MVSICKLDDSESGREVYGLLLRCLRNSQRVKRKIFGQDLPEWLSESLKLIHNVSLVSTLPTVTAILLVPRHFFRRLNTRGKKTVLFGLSPIKLLLNCAAMAALCAGVFGFRPGSYFFLLTALVVAVASPLWLTFGVVLTAAVAAFSKKIRQAPGMGIINFIAFKALGYILPYKDCMRALEIIRFFRLSGSKAAWGFAYLSMVLFLYEIAVIAGVAGIVVLLEPGQQGNGIDPILAQLFAIVIVLLVGLSTRPFAASYTAMVSSAKLYPRRSYFNYRVKQLIKASNKFYDGDDDAKYQYQRQISEIVWLTLLDNLEAEQVLAKKDELRAGYLESRQHGLMDADSLDVFFDTRDELQLSACFAAMKQPICISQSELLPASFSRPQFWIAQ